jgi:hypothetical protein
LGRLVHDHTIAVVQGFAICFMHSVKSSVVKALKSTVAYLSGAYCSRGTHTCLVEQPLYRFPIMYHCSRASACFSEYTLKRTDCIRARKQAMCVKRNFLAATHRLHGFTRTADIHRAVGPQNLALALRCNAENM